MAGVTASESDNRPYETARKIAGLWGGLSALLVVLLFALWRFSALGDFANGFARGWRGKGE